MKRYLICLIVVLIIIKQEILSTKEIWIPKNYLNSLTLLQFDSVETTKFRYPIDFLKFEKKKLYISTTFSGELMEYSYKFTNRKSNTIQLTTPLIFISNFNNDSVKNHYLNNTIFFKMREKEWLLYSSKKDSIIFEKISLFNNNESNYYNLITRLKIKGTYCFKDINNIVLDSNVNITSNCKIENSKHLKMLNIEIPENELMDSQIKPKYFIIKLQFHNLQTKKFYVEINQKNGLEFYDFIQERSGFKKLNLKYKFTFLKK